MKVGKRETIKVVEASSVEDYLERYYKHDRYKGRGEEYEAILLKSYTEEFSDRGYVCTSHHDNVTGEFIAWPHHPGNEVE